MISSATAEGSMSVMPSSATAEGSMSLQVEIGGAKHNIAECEHVHEDIEACSEALQVAPANSDHKARVDALKIMEVAPPKAAGYGEALEAARTEVSAPKAAGSVEALEAARTEVAGSAEAPEAARTEVALPKAAGSASLDLIISRLDALEAARTSLKALEVAPPKLEGSDSLAMISSRLDALEAARTEAVPKMAVPKMVAQEKEDIIWLFVGYVYCIFAAQFCISGGIAILFFKIHRILKFLGTHSTISWVVYFSLLLSVPIVWHTMLKFRKKWPHNVALLVLFNITANMALQLFIPSDRANMMVLTTILSMAASIGLILFAMWARIKSFRSSFAIPALVGAITVLATYAITRLWNPMGLLSSNNYSLIFSILISTVLVFEVKKSTEIHTREEIFVASIGVYVRLLNEVGSRASFSLL